MQRFSLVPVNMNIQASMLACFDNPIINTSVSGVATTTVLYVELACLAYISIRVSASSRFESSSTTEQHELTVRLKAFAPEVT